MTLLLQYLFHNLDSDFDIKTKHNRNQHNTIAFQLGKFDSTT